MLNMRFEQQQRKLDARIRMFGDAQQKWESAMAIAETIQADSYKTCSELRKICHADVDAYVDNIQMKISNFITTTKTMFKKNLTMVQSKLQENTKRKNVLTTQTMDTSNLFSVDVHNLLKEAQA